MCSVMALQHDTANAGVIVHFGGTLSCEDEEVIHVCQQWFRNRTLFLSCGCCGRGAVSALQNFPDGAGTHWCNKRTKKLTASMDSLSLTHIWTTNDNSSWACESSENNGNKLKMNCWMKMAKHGSPSSKHSKDWCQECASPSNCETQVMDTDSATGQKRIAPRKAVLFEIGCPTYQHVQYDMCKFRSTSAPLTHSTPRRSWRVMIHSIDWFRVWWFTHPIFDLGWDSIRRHSIICISYFSLPLSHWFLKLYR